MANERSFAFPLHSLFAVIIIAPWFESLFTLSVSVSLLPLVHTMTAKFIDFTADEKEKAPHLELALEGLLRGQNLQEEVNMAFRCNDVLTRSVFVALDSSEERLTKTATTFRIRVESGEFV